MIERWIMEHHRLLWERTELLSVTLMELREQLRLKDEIIVAMETTLEHRAAIVAAHEGNIDNLESLVAVLEGGIKSRDEELELLRLIEVRSDRDHRGIMYVLEEFRRSLERPDDDPRVRMDAMRADLLAILTAPLEVVPPAVAPAVETPTQRITP